MPFIDPSEAERLTQDLVGISSVTGTPGEIEIAVWIHRWLTDRGVKTVLQPLGDGRRNVFAFVRGSSPRTVILMGHFDTVPPSPGQALAAPAGSGDDARFLFGRGSLDMKSGIAVAMLVMSRLQRENPPPEVSVLFVATCDEEVESSGILGAIGVLAALRAPASATAAGKGSRDAQLAVELTGGSTCEPVGVLNVDYTTERYPGDPECHAWNGTVGKLLAGVYVRGYQTHAGEYFRGFHAMGLLARIVTAIDGNTDLSLKAPPPVTLKLKDAKDEYNVMTSPAGWAYFNIFTTGRAPEDLLRMLRRICEAAVSEYSAELSAAFERYGEAAELPAGGLVWDAPVLSWSELRRQASTFAGPSTVAAAMQSVRALQTRRDIREEGMDMIAALLELTGRRDPAVVLAFLPPFYPYISPDGGPFGSAVRDVLAGRSAAAGRTVTVEEYYPYISDMSYLRIEPEIRRSLGGLTSEMPSWDEGYSLDFETIGRVDLPVVNLGPYGFGAHQPEERVGRDFSFAVLPELIRDVVRALK